MKIQYMSDLHLEFAPYELEPLGDVLVLAGDIISSYPSSHKRLRSLLEKASDMDSVLMVMGNHEGYGWSLEKAYGFLAELSDEFKNFEILDMTSKTVSGITFHGCPLWSHPAEDVQFVAQYSMNDYRKISGWSINQHICEHDRQVAWLKKVVQNGDVVITHFPPTQVAINQDRYSGDQLNSWYANDLDDLILDLAPAVWISGHTHNKWDTMVGTTSVVGNCRGYAMSYNNYDPEVSQFSDLAIIEI